MLLYLWDYTICDSWNTYHVIKTVQVDPFVPYLHFKLPEDDNYLFTVRQMRGRGCEGRGWQQRKMVEDDWNCLMLLGGLLFCMAMVGQGGWFHNGWVDKCREAGFLWSWEGLLPQQWKDLCFLTVPLTPFQKKIDPRLNQSIFSIPQKHKSQLTKCIFQIKTMICIHYKLTQSKLSNITFFFMLKAVYGFIFCIISPVYHIVLKYSTFQFFTCAQCKLWMAQVFHRRQSFRIPLWWEVGG